MLNNSESTAHKNNAVNSTAMVMISRVCSVSWRVGQTTFRTSVRVF
jgi:hypothetical protein